MREEKLQALFDDYSSYHRDPINCLTHAVGFPMIFIGLFFERRWPETLERLARFEAVGHLWFLDLALRIARHRN